MPEKPKIPLENLIDFTADKTMDLYNKSSVLSPAVTNDDGSRVITVSDLSIGFAGGSMGGNEKSKDTPAGAGGKISVKPKALIIMKNGEIKIENIGENKPSALVSVLKTAKSLIKK